MINIDCQTGEKTVTNETINVNTSDFAKAVRQTRNRLLAKAILHSLPMCLLQIKRNGRNTGRR